MRLFEDELQNIYWAEQALTKAFPKMIKNATAQELIKALEQHLTETEQQVTRVEQVFESIGQPAIAIKCEGIEGLIREAEEMIDDCEEGTMCDAGIIFAAQKIEHYEIATYGTLRQFAETLGLTEAMTLLEQTLNEEKHADENLTQIAVAGVNVEASAEMENS
ncbi:MAG TPA: ferritin-like domain-containing protein [Saprospiraceae bacterium]|nr:ferritin-like domain-containing protein [Saprospiraceae bacterium]